MEWKKAKTLIIIMLLAVDLFLLLNVFVKYSKAASAERESLKDALSLASENGGFTEEVFSSIPVYLYSYSASRNVGAEFKFADALLTETPVKTEAGGGVYIYSDGDDRLVFRRGGFVEGSVKTPVSDDDAEGIVAALRTAGLKCSLRGGTVSFTYKGLPVSNVSLRITRNGEFLRFSGSVPLSSGFSRQTRSRSRGELVLELASVIRERELGDLISVTAEYRLSAGGSQTLELIPVLTAECVNGNVVLNMIDKTAY